LTKVPVAFICDSHYVIPTAVAITSLICNKNPDTYYDIYVIAVALSEAETEKFYEFIGNSADIHIIKATLEKFKGIYKSGYITPAVYLKFDLPELITDQDKVLYLDSDVIIQKDLADLFEINIEGYYAGVVKDIGLIDNNLNIKNYFNSGVMLLNLKMMRESNTSMALLNIRKSPNKFTFMDQDCFNIIFDNKVKLLPVIYNCFYNFILQNKEKYTLEYINNCFGTYYSSLDNVKKDSCIIHLVSNDKPWLYFDAVMAREWDEYFKKSPFKFYKLKRESIKLYKFITSHDFAKPAYSFFMHWRNEGFKFAMGKVRKQLLNSRSV